MRILHCADLHLDSPLTTHFTSEMAKERRSELLQTFLRMVDYAAEHDVQAILIAGDLFDRRRISVTARNTVLSAIQNHPHIVFFYVTGNHERDGFLSAVAEIPANLKLFGPRWRSYEAGNIKITGADLEAANKQQLSDSLVLDASRFNIVLLHGQVAAYASDDKAEIIDLGSFRNKHIDYLALGHLHAYREEPLDARGIWCYPGCLEGRGFDEIGEHGFVLLEIDADAGTFTRTFVPFASRILQEVSVDVSGTMTSAEMIDVIDRSLGDRLPKGAHSPDLWIIVLSGAVDVSCEKDTELIARHFAERAYFVRVKDETRLQVNAHDFAKDISLKGEFVRLVEADTTLGEEEKAEIIRCGLQALTGEEWTA